MVDFSWTSLATLFPGLRSEPLRALPVGLFGAGLLLSLSTLVSPAGALALGLVLAFLFRAPLPHSGGKLSGYLLRAGVVFLGFRMSFTEVLDTGIDGLMMAAVTILGTMVLGYLVGRWLGVGSRTSTLISAGTAVCGGSAIAALAPVIGALEGEIAVALGTVFILNAIALYLFPWLGDWLQLAPESFGLWSGVAIHDLSSVVGAASQYSPDALQIAIAVKLSRTLWIVPLALVMGFQFQGLSQDQKTSIKVPYFVVFFLVASLSRDWIPGVESLAPHLGRMADALLAAALFVIGGSICPRSLRQLGWKPMGQGLILWVFISAAALAATLVV